MEGKREGQEITGDTGSEGERWGQKSSLLRYEAGDLYSVCRCEVCGGVVTVEKLSYWIS